MLPETQSSHIKEKTTETFKGFGDTASPPPFLNLHLYLTPLCEDRSNLRLAVGRGFLSTRGFSLPSPETGERKLKNAKEQQ